MKDKVSFLLTEARNLESAAEVRLSVVALVRIILQHACISLAELLVDNRKRRNITGVELHLEQLSAPADGTLVSLLGELLIHAENEGWNGISKPFFAPIQPGNPCEAFATNKYPNLETVLLGYVYSRNDGVEGHGIPGRFNRDADLSLVENLLESLSPILPKIGDDGQELILTMLDGTKYTLKFLHACDGNLICYRKITKKSSNRWAVKAQEQKGLFEKADLYYECEGVDLDASNNVCPTYDITETFDENWSPICLMPERMTDDFTGRSKELDKLLEWTSDLESRACIVYGDGGIGKTTITIEFIHRLLEGMIKPVWKPTLITFYTAKQTRWGLTGLEHIQARGVGVSDVAIAIARAFENKPLGKEWFKCDVFAQINKIAGYLRDFGIDRNSHLLILDNTETMAKNEEDIRALADQVQELSRKVGRVILTSRRRESIEAKPIEVKPFTIEDSVEFLKKRAKALNRKPLLQAGESTLRRYSEKLGNKPLVLEVFIQAVEADNTSLTKAFDRVLRMQRQDLGEFLYTDAWMRMSETTRHLLLLMTRVSDIHDDVLLKLCCIQVGVLVIEAIEAIEESRGIATIAYINNKIQITFNSEFLAFCAERTIKIGGFDCPTANTVNTVNRRYNDFLRSATAQVKDRVSRAYMHTHARAAWLAFKESRFEDCELFYEEASISDSKNGWLFDRYAYFFYMMGRYPEALEKTKRATSLIPDDPEAWFTRGMVEARLGCTKLAIQSLNKAAKNGKPMHLCLLQEAYAYLNDSPPDFANARACLDESIRKADKTDSYYEKHVAEIHRVRNRIK